MNTAMHQFSVRPWDARIIGARVKNFERIQLMDDYRWEKLSMQWDPNVVDDESQEYVPYRNVGRPILRWTDPVGLTVNEMSIWVSKCVIDRRLSCSYTIDVLWLAQELVIMRRPTSDKVPTPVRRNPTWSINSGDMQGWLGKVENASGKLILWGIQLPTIFQRLPTCVRRHPTPNEGSGGSIQNDVRISLLCM